MGVQGPTKPVETPQPVNDPARTGSAGGPEGTGKTPPPDSPRGEGAGPTRDSAPPPPPPTTGSSADIIRGALVSEMQMNTAMSTAVGENAVENGTFQTETTDRQQNIKQAERDNPRDSEQQRTNNAERGFVRSDQDLSTMRQKLFQNLLSSQQKDGQYSTEHHQQTRGPAGQGKEDATLKQQQFFRARGSFSQGLAKENAGAPWKQMQFKMELPKGFHAYMGDGPRGRFISIATEKQLKWKQFGEEGKEESALKEAMKEDGEPKTKEMTPGMMAAQKKAAKQMGQKEGADEAKEEEEILETEAEEGTEDVEEGDDAGLNAMRKAMQAKAAKAKGKGEEEEGGPEDRSGFTFQSLIEDHNVLLVAADHGESASLVSQAQFAGAIIMGASMHIKLKGARLNYSGTSHHGLPIPSGDESLAIGAEALVSGLERDMGQLGVETVFVNGQRFELANKDDERKLRELVKDNPDLHRAIENIREAIRESRFYRTCMGLMEEGPGGRA